MQKHLVGAWFHPRPEGDDRRRYGVALAAGGGGRPQRGNPRRGSPLYPLLRFISPRGVPRAAARGQGSAPGPRPLFCKKAGQKTFKRQSTSDPNPSPLGRVIQSVREADTLAAEWHLPREWERRVGPETSRGRHHPKRFSLGLHPVSLGKTKEMGWNRQHKVKTTKSKTASSSNPQNPGGPGTPPLQRYRTVGRAVFTARGSPPSCAKRAPSSWAVYSLSRWRPPQQWLLCSQSWGRPWL